MRIGGLLQQTSGGKISGVDLQCPSSRGAGSLTVTLLPIDRGRGIRIIRDGGTLLFRIFERLQCRHTVASLVMKQAQIIPSAME